jgi:hypothetical protein
MNLESKGGLYSVSKEWKKRRAEQVAANQKSMEKMSTA